MIQEISFYDIAYALIIMAVCGVIAWAYIWRLHALLKKLADKTSTSLDNLVIDSLKWPVISSIILIGICFSVQSLPLADWVADIVDKVLLIVPVALVGWAGSLVLNSVYNWYKLTVASKTKSSLDDGIIAVLRIGTPLLAVFWVVVNSLRILDFDTTPISIWMEDYGNRIGLIILVSVILLFIIGKILPAMVRGIIYQRAYGQPDEEDIKRADTLSNVLSTAGQVLVIAISILMVLSELGIDIVPILTGVGVAGIAIGFGAQTLVKDYFGGLFIIMENQYRVGDVVKIAGISGVVEQLDLRRTVLRDLDGIQHVICNGDIRVASNFTKGVSGVNINISVSYDTNLDHAISVINQVCRDIAEDPNWAPLIVSIPQVLRVDNLGDSGIEIKVLGETKPSQQWNVMGEIRKKVKQAFDAEGIEIPWPHTKIYFGNSPWQTERKDDTGKSESVKSKLSPVDVPESSLKSMLPDSSDGE